MKVLVACEFSGVVRDAFTARGHTTVSCDLLPTESEGSHYQGDVRDLLDADWDLMIAHPPCTYLANIGASWFNEDKYGQKAKERKDLRLKAFEFVQLLNDAPIPRICIENPVGWLNSHLRKPEQIIQPYQFGDPWTKRTCLWLKGLSLLIATNIVEPTGRWVSSGKKCNDTIWQQGGTEGGKTDQKRRSMTFQGIADAMAEQWGKEVTQN